VELAFSKPPRCRRTVSRERWVVGDDQEVSVVNAEILDVPGRPRDQLLVKCESLTTSTPDVDERLWRAKWTGAVIGHCQVQLHVTASVVVTRGYNYDSTSIRRPFDCLSKVIKVTLTSHTSGRWPAIRSPIYLSRRQCSRSHTVRPTVVMYVVEW